MCRPPEAVVTVDAVDKAVKDGSFEVSGKAGQSFQVVATVGSAKIEQTLVITLEGHAQPDRIEVPVAPAASEPTAAPVAVGPRGTGKRDTGKGDSAKTDTHKGDTKSDTGKGAATASATTAAAPPPATTTAPPKVKAAVDW